MTFVKDRGHRVEQARQNGDRRHLMDGRHVAVPVGRADASTCRLRGTRAALGQSVSFILLLFRVRSAGKHKLLLDLLTQQNPSSLLSHPDRKVYLLENNEFRFDFTWKRTGRWLLQHALASSPFSR